LVDEIKEKINGRGVWNIRKRTYTQIGFNKVSPKETDRLEVPGTDRRIRVHWNLKKLCENLWSGLIWHSM
jgi:hypothetical protein